MELLHTAAKAHMQLDQPQGSLYCFNEILAMDPIREDIHFEAIRLLSGLGRGHDAIRQYNLLRETLQRELGVEPDPTITAYMGNIRLPGR